MTDLPIPIVCKCMKVFTDSTAQTAHLQSCPVLISLLDSLSSSTQSIAMVYPDYVIADRSIVTKSHYDGWTALLVHFISRRRVNGRLIAPAGQTFATDRRYYTTVHCNVLSNLTPRADLVQSRYKLALQRAWKDPKGAAVMTLLLKQLDSDKEKLQALARYGAGLIF